MSVARVLRQAQHERMLVKINKGPLILSLSKDARNSAPGLMT